MRYQQEALRTAHPEINAFLKQQWLHTGDADLECEPCWEAYYALEAKGGASLLTARDNERLVGYLMFVSHKHINSQSILIATVATYFVELRRNRAMVLRQLFKQAIDKARVVGARQLKVRTEFHNSCGRLLEAMGFEPEEIGYKLRLGGTLQEAKHA